MLTDGILFDSDFVLERSVMELHETLGARVFVIGIGEVRETQVRLKIAKSHDMYA